MGPGSRELRSLGRDDSGKYFNLTGKCSKYRLAFVIDGACVVRYDNEAGKGDHRHFGARQEPYAFTTHDVLLADFWHDVQSWRAR